MRLCSRPWPLTSLYTIIKAAVRYWHSMVPQICISSVLRPFAVTCFWSLSYLFCSSCLLFEMLLNVFYSCCFFLMNKAWGCVLQLLALLMHSLMLRSKKNDVFFCLFVQCWNYAEADEKQNVLSQSWISSIQIWSHIIYSSWGSGLCLTMFPGEPKRRDDNTEDTEWRNIVTTFCTDFLLSIYIFSAHFIV